jgi:hypothetical protein
MADRKRPEPKSKSIPITGRSIFISEAQAQIELDHPEMRKLEIFRLLGNQWDHMGDTERSAYEKRADYSRRAESRKTTSARRREPGGSEAKISAFSVFSKERHGALKQSSPQLTLAQRSQIIADEWKQLSKSDKTPFINIAKRETRSIRRSLPDDDSDELSESEFGGM